jgi:Cytochrome c7 and related cytochrome c
MPSVSPNPEPGDRMTFPAASKCMTCHATISKNEAPIQKLAEFAKSATAIPWARVYVLPGWVYWNHRSHLDAGMTCEMCHGQVAKMDVIAKVTDGTTMAGCIDCHRKNDVSTECKFCHTDK